MDPMFERLNKIFPNSGFVKIEKYDPKLWEGREYDSHLDFKAAMTKWASSPMDYEEAIEVIKEGYRIGQTVRVKVYDCTSATLFGTVVK